jgi:hypothetical protein
MAIDDESEGEVQTDTKNKGGVIPEEGSAEPAPTSEHHQRTRQDALGELYKHEVMALASCFLFPMIGAYLLHAIRAQLSRPSEGLVSNYNLTIFLLAAEIHPLSHLIKLVQSRTLHLQRVVHANPYKGTSATLSQVQDVVRRIEELESRSNADNTKSSIANSGNSPPAKQPDTAALVREVRNTIQPELDALNRAVRRYEKKATVLAFQTEARLGVMDTRLGDAIALAAQAAKIGASQRSFMAWVADKVVWLVVFPFHALLSVITLPFTTVMKLLGLSRLWSSDKTSTGSSTAASAHRDRRATRSNTASTGMSRMNSSDRVPTRLSKR